MSIDTRGWHGRGDLRRWAPTLGAKWGTPHGQLLIVLKAVITSGLAVRRQLYAVCGATRDAACTERDTNAAAPCATAPYAMASRIDSHQAWGWVGLPPPKPSPPPPLLSPSLCIAVAVAVAVPQITCGCDTLQSAALQHAFISKCPSDNQPAQRFAALQGHPGAKWWGANRP